MNRKNPKSRSKAKQRLSRVLAHGGSIVIFPEGRVSTDGRLDVFRSGATELAFEHDCPIVPVALKGTNSIIGPTGFSFNLRASAEIQYLDAIKPSSYDSPEEMNDALRSIIAQGSGQELV